MASNFEYSAPLVSGGPDSQGALLVVVTYSLMFVSMLVAGARLYSTIHRSGSFAWDDAFFFSALVRYNLQTMGR